MSKNCLITKFKSVVDNDSLKVIGHVKLLLTPKAGSPSPWIKVNCVKSIHATCTDTLKLNNATEYNFTPNYITLCSVSGSGYLVIEDKYSLSHFENHDVDVSVIIDDLTYSKMTTCSIITTNLPTGSIDAFINSTPTLSVIKLQSNKLFGDLSNVKQSILNGISEFQLASPNIEGSVTSFANGSLTVFSVNNCSKLIGTIESIGNKQNHNSIEIYNSGVSGSLDAYVASAIASGKTSAINFPFTGALSNLTFNGAKQDTTGISTIAPCFVSWDNNGKISVITGNYNPASCTHVFCKGYTQSEAESAFPGKTIIRVDA